MTLRKRAEAAAGKLMPDCGCSKMSYYPCPHCDRTNEMRTDRESIADAIEREARAFAERALRGIYDVDDNDQTGSDGERSRGSYRVRREFNPLETPSSVIEKRHYRKEFNEMIAEAIKAAAEESE